MESAEKMPVLFVGHGNPMNAIEDNEFAREWERVGKTLPVPRAILCISAHWETRGTLVTAMEQPETIHDFGGFPKALFEVEYPAPGSPELAAEVQGSVAMTEVRLDERWGFDHGAWSVLKRMYPHAGIPVVELSLDYYKSPQEHYELAKELSFLRKKEVLIIGSGNMVHNLGMVDWRRLNMEFAYDWAAEASQQMKQFILNGDHQQLVRYEAQGRAYNLAIPTPEHYLPLLYVMALKEENEQVSLFNDTAVGGSLTMTSVKIGLG
jgi:4,5-DOPA dioxygenase extradiol